MKYFCQHCGDYTKKRLDEAEQVWGPVCPGCGIRETHIYTPFTPSWRKYEPGVHHPDTKTQMEQTDKFIAEREHAVKTDSQAKRWEEGRKKEWARNKPHWAKKMAEKGIL